MDALRDSMMRRNPIYMEQLPKMILDKGAEQGKLPRSTYGMDNTPTERRIIDVVGMLFNEGIITWGASIGAGLFNTNTISITEYGQKILLDEEALNPHDPDKYLQRFKARVPYATALTMMYLEENLYCYNQERLLASSVMLGVSSEAAFEELYDALIAYIGDPHKDKLKKLKDAIDSRAKFDKTMEILGQEKSKFPSDIKNMALDQLQGLFHIIRLQRNESGHPTGTKPIKEDMRGYLTIFPMYCEYVYKLTKWLRDNTTV